MSQQLTVSSLFSAFALVALCLFARVTDGSEMPTAPASLVSIEAGAGFSG